MDSRTKEIVYPDIEPGIINREMIEKAYLDDGKKGEQARLHQMEPVIYDRILALRLECKNILRIDHLWILPNLTKLSLNFNKIEVIEHLEMLTALKELDLSFNYIEKIENLEKLVHLEVLTLFNNLITKIENLDTLEDLTILSIGNNKIDTTDGIERFRFLKKLRVLNLEGNPIAQNPEFPFSLYIAAVLPKLKYYEYAAIKDEDREIAREKFARQLRDISVNEELELNERAQREKERFDEERLSLSFVEYLNEHQLYESLWKGDEDGRVLMMVGQAVKDLAEDYKKDIFDITQEIYKFGLERYEERDVEIKEFLDSLEAGQKEIQTYGQSILEDFMQYKEKIFEKATTCLRNLEVRNLRGEDEDSPESVQLADQYDEIVLAFDDTTNDVWQQLMGQELHLHEGIEETTTLFQRRIQEMMGKFVEQAQTYFAQLREVALHFSENITEIVTQYISIKQALKDFDDVPPELLHVMDDRDAVMNMIAGMKDSHIQRIDEREDRLIVRSREFIEQMVEKLMEDELKRNRAKILEINTFLESMTESLSNIHEEIREQLQNEES